MDWRSDAKSARPGRPGPPVGAFGGYTEIQGFGGHAAENGELIEEQVDTIEVSYAVAKDELIVGLADEIKAGLRQ